MWKLNTLLTTSGSKKTSKRKLKNILRPKQKHMKYSKSTKRELYSNKAPTLKKKDLKQPSFPPQGTRKRTE